MILNGLMPFLAQTNAPQPGQPMQQDPRAGQLQMLGLMAMAVIMLIFMTKRSQSKKDKEHAELLKAMKPGDKVVTSSGIVGVVVSVKEKTIALRSADTKMEVLKSAVTAVTERAGESSATES
jgi:preprotein translocase subunit YajC